MTKLPEDQCERIHAGESPLLVWMEWLRMGLQDVTDATGLTVDYLHQCILGNRELTDEQRELVAAALAIHPLDLKAVELIEYE